MMLGALLEEMPAAAVRGDLEIEITGLAYDSRRVRRGDLFFALGGLHVDGRAFVRQALDAGAAAVVLAHPAGEAVAAGVTRVEVEQPRHALAQAAGKFYEHPARQLRMVGVTGTNGKTTTTWMMQSIFAAAGIPAGLIGTTGARFAGQARPSAFTTPEAPELQAVLREMVQLGLQGAALELSSIALDQQRCFGIEPQVVVFTNLSHDHLDYHGTLERYLDAKLRLFDGRNDPARTRPGTAVINADDPAAPTVREAARRGGLEVMTFGAGGGGELAIEEIDAHTDGLRFTLRDRARKIEIALPLLGRHNAWNAAAAYGAARALGIAPEPARRGLMDASGVPGRLERVDAGQRFAAVVDYAHTPDALARALAAMREHFSGRVLLVFGCGGDRDRQKRPVMGRIAAAGADVAWITNDNPRGEDPQAIAAEIRAGDPRGRLRVELDRRAAMAAAFAEARPGDVVLVAGKGHETTQTIGLEVMPFDDREVARTLLAAGGARA